jgi:hypothetical protein
MANEIQLSASLSCTKSGATVTGTSSNVITQAGTPSIANVQIVGTTTEALLIGDITNIGYVYLKNLDATNFVQVGLNTPVADADSFITLLAGECAVFPTRLEVIYAKANTAPCNVQVVAVSL